MSRDKGVLGSLASIMYYSFVCMSIIALLVLFLFVAHVVTGPYATKYKILMPLFGIVIFFYNLRLIQTNLRKAKGLPKESIVEDKKEQS